MIEESPRFDLDAGLAQMAPDEIHNLLPLRDLDFFKDEFKHSPIHQFAVSQYLAPNYAGYVPVRGDGNCAYRSAFVGLLLHIIQKNEPKLLQDFVELIKSADYFQEQETVISYLEQICQVEREQGKESALALFLQMVVLSKQFDHGCVRWLRQLISQYIKNHEEATIEGLPLQFIKSEKYATLQAYCKRCVEPMGEEAQDLAVYLIPVVLRIQVVNVMVQKNATGGYKVETYRAELDGAKQVMEDRLNFHDQHIDLFFRPGHYEILIPHEYVEKGQKFQEAFAFFRKIGYGANGEKLSHLSYVERYNLEKQPEKKQEIGNENEDIHKNQEEKEVRAEDENDLQEDQKSIEREEEDEEVLLDCSDIENKQEFIEYMQKCFGFKQKDKNWDILVKNLKGQGQQNLSSGDLRKVWPDLEMTIQKFAAFKVKYRQEKMRESDDATRQMIRAPSQNSQPDQNKVQQEKKPVDELIPHNEPQYVGALRFQKVQPAEVQGENNPPERQQEKSSVFETLKTVAKGVAKGVAVGGFIAGVFYIGRKLLKT